jgi:hypothetical protein
MDICIYIKLVICTIDSNDSIPVTVEYILTYVTDFFGKDYYLLWSSLYSRTGVRGSNSLNKSCKRPPSQGSEASVLYSASLTASLSIVPNSNQAFCHGF